MSDLVLPSDFDPVAYLEELEATLQRMKDPSPTWQEALVMVQREERAEPQHCTAEEFAQEHGI